MKRATKRVGKSDGRFEGGVSGKKIPSRHSPIRYGSRHCGPPGNAPSYVHSLRVSLLEAREALLAREYYPGEDGSADRAIAAYAVADMLGALPS